MNSDNNETTIPRQLAHNPIHNILLIESHVGVERDP